MAPTTVLAAQHFRTLQQRFPEDVRIKLLTGRMKPKDSALIREEVRLSEKDLYTKMSCLAAK